MIRILVVDDEPQILRALRINPAARRYEVEVAGDGSSAPRGWSSMPILVLSGRTATTDKITALDRVGQAVDTGEARGS